MRNLRFVEHLDFLPTGKDFAGLGRLCLCVVWVCLFAQLLPLGTFRCTLDSEAANMSRHAVIYQHNSSSNGRFLFDWHSRTTDNDRPAMTAYQLEHQLLRDVSRYKDAIYLSSDTESQDENAFLVATLAVGSHYLLICFALWVLLIPDAGRHSLTEGL